MDPRNVFPDNVYRSVEITNSSSMVSSINFDTNLGSAIINNPRMYYLLVTKFSLSNKAFPIFFFDNRDYSPLETKGYYIIKDGFKTMLTMEAADYRGNPYGLEGESNLYGGVYFINQFLNMINRVIAPSQMTLLDDGRFNMFLSGDLIFSRKLYDLFPTMEATYTQTGYRMFGGDQESKSQYAWYDIKSIIIISNDLPILFQGISTKFDSTKRLKILQEFPPIYSQGDSIDKSDWIFESTQYRPIDMLTQDSFSNFSFDVKLMSKYGTLIEYKLLPGDSASVTFRFAKKSLFNNEYNISNESQRIKQNPQYAYHKY
jgi:hypothetical protein